jgi:hypothetical protein
MQKKKKFQTKYLQETRNVLVSSQKKTKEIKQKKNLKYSSVYKQIRKKKNK